MPASHQLQQLLRQTGATRTFDLIRTLDIGLAIALCTISTQHQLSIVTIANRNSIHRDSDDVCNAVVTLMTFAT